MDREKEIKKALANLNKKINNYEEKKEQLEDELRHINNNRKYIIKKWELRVLLKNKDFPCGYGYDTNQSILREVCSKEVETYTFKKDNDDD